MPFACDHEIIIPIIAHFAGPLRCPCGNGTGNSGAVCLTFFAAKTTPHPADFNTHLMHAKTQRMGNLVLHFAWMLGGTMHHHFQIVRWKGKGGLPFEVKMFLSPDGEGPLKGHFRIRNCLHCIALFINARPLFKIIFLRKRIFYAQNGGVFAVGNHSFARRFAREKVALRNDKKNRLSDVMHLSISEERFIHRRRGAVIFMRQVLGGNDPQNTLGR